MTSPDPRLHSPFCPRGWPPGRRRLDVWTERGSFPVWGWFTLPAHPAHAPREVHGNLGPATLGLSAGLAAGLRAWAHRYDEGVEPGDRGVWLDQGRELADRLGAETGALVVYRWPADGHDPSCPDCPP